MIYFESGQRSTLVQYIQLYTWWIILLLTKGTEIGELSKTSEEYLFRGIIGN